MKQASTRTSEARTAALKNWGIDGCALGISIGGVSTAREWKAARDWVKYAEQRRLHSVWLPEMHFTPGSATSPLLCLAALAARTRSIRLATTSLLLPIHDPLRVAEEVASLDVLSGGRVILGLGRGFQPALFKAFGIDPSQKRDRFDAALDLILAAWRGESKSLKATPFDDEKLQQVRPVILPHQRPHPPLAVAAFGTKGLAQAARRGLPYLASPMESFDQIRDNLQTHSEQMPSEPMPGHSVVPIMRTVFVSPHRATRQRVLEALAAENRNPGGMRRGRVPAAIARAMASPLEDRVVVGEVNEVGDRLSRYREELGMNLMVIRPQIRGAEKSERMISVELLLEEVMPTLA